MTWEYTSVDTDLLEEVSALIDFDTSLLSTENIESGTQLTHNIDTIYDYDGYWELYMNYVIDDNSYSTSISQNVYNDISLISNDSFSQIDEDQFRILPVDLEEYISNFLDDIEDKNYIKITKSDDAFEIEQTVNSTTIVAKFHYNEDGVLEDFELQCNSTSALKYTLSDYTNGSDDFTGIIIAVVVIVVVIAIFIAIAMVANKKTKKPPYKPITPKSTVHAEFQSSTSTVVKPPTSTVVQPLTSTAVKPSTIEQNSPPNYASFGSMYDKFDLKEDDLLDYIKAHKNEKTGTIN